MKIRIKKELICLLLTINIYGIYAQDQYETYRKSWLQKAKESTPQLIVTEKQPVRLVTIEKDPEAFQHYKAVPTGTIEELYNHSFKERREVIVDFGEHLTGSFSFNTQVTQYTADAPLRFKLTFGEVPSEVITPFDPYPGTLSRAWLQDEIMTVMELPATVTVPRRVSFRYVKIEVLASSSYDFNISGLVCKAVTSAATVPATLLPTTPQLFKEIDRISLNTLKECMQTVYEDGPKRDQRLWMGDLYLEALANNFSFKQHDLTKRCLYLLAGCAEEDGLLNGTLFESPEPHPQARQLLIDYSYLFGVALKDYLLATGDKETAEDLWPVVVKQLETAVKYQQKNGLLDYNRVAGEWWIFFDWKDGLHKEVALHGITLFTMQECYELARLLGKEKEVAHLPGMIKTLKSAARKHYYDKKTGLYRGVLNDQVSYASQIWMVLGGVPTKAEARRALKALKVYPGVIRPGGPYLYHYYIEALLKSELYEEARQEVADYWGAMVKKGADTFWEVYDPADEFRSPYNFYPVNSYCHAWSCTPTYFIRKYPDIFQK